MKKPSFKIGLIHELIQFMSGQKMLSDRWNQFRIKGNDLAQVKWFVIDISS